MRSSKPPHSMSMRIFASLTRSRGLLQVTQRTEIRKRLLEQLGRLGFADQIFSQCAKNELFEEFRFLPGIFLAGLFLPPAVHAEKLRHPAVMGVGQNPEIVGAMHPALHAQAIGLLQYAKLIRLKPGSTLAQLLSNLGFRGKERAGKPVRCFLVVKLRSQAAFQHQVAKLVRESEPLPVTGPSLA